MHTIRNVKVKKADLSLKPKLGINRNSSKLPEQSMDPFAKSAKILGLKKTSIFEPSNIPTSDLG